MPKGTYGAYVTNVSGRPQEQEMLFLPNAYLKLLDSKRIHKEKIRKYPVYNCVLDYLNSDLQDIVKGYGIEINRSGFCSCPFHEEKTPSMKIYEKGYYCFGCNEKGDQIKFVQKFFNLENPLDAAKKINEDFSLGLNFNYQPTKEEFISAKNIVAERQQFERYEKAAFNTLSDYFKLLQDYGRQYAPKSESEILDNRFVEYLHNFEHVDYIANRMIELMHNPINERKEFLKDNEDYLVLAAQKLMDHYDKSHQQENEVQTMVNKSTPSGERIQPKPLVGSIIGNTPYKAIKEKSYLKYSNVIAPRIADNLQKYGVPFSGRVYSKLTTFTVNKKDLDKLRNIAENVTRDFTAKQRPQLIPSAEQQKSAQKQMTAANRQQSRYNEILL